MTRGTGLQLTALILIGLFTENIDMIFDELEKNGNKENAA
jgi:hypothetical protein